LNEPLEKNFLNDKKECCIRVVPDKLVFGKFVGFKTFFVPDKSEKFAK